MIRAYVAKNPQYVTRSVSRTWDSLEPLLTTSFDITDLVESTITRANYGLNSSFQMGHLWNTNALDLSSQKNWAGVEQPAQWKTSTTNA